MDDDWGSCKSDRFSISLTSRAKALHNNAEYETRTRKQNKLVFRGLRSGTLVDANQRERGASGLPFLFFLFILIFFTNIYKNPRLHSQGQTQRYNPCNNLKRNQPVQPPF